MSIDINTRKSKISTKYSGLSGPAIRPIGIASVHKLFQAVQIPIIGIGGITNSKETLEYMIAGASAVQVGTANYRHPEISITIIDDLISYAEQYNFNSLTEFVGTVL